MEILNSYATFLLFLIVGIIMYFLTPFLFIKIDMKKLDNYLAKQMLHLTSLVFILCAIVGALFRLSGTMFDSRILQAGFFTVISIIPVEYYIYRTILSLIDLSAEEINDYKLEGNIEKMGMFSILFILWIIYTLFFAMGSYICAFFYFEKISATVATSFIIFILNLFIGIDVINKVNKVITKVNNNTKS